MQLKIVKLPDWMYGPYYKDRHRYGVICSWPAEGKGFTVYRSHKTPEKALAAAESLNKVKLLGAEFEAVEFQ